MNRQLPPNPMVRFDYHRHPRSTTAVVINQRTRNVVAVGVAKFNPRDGEPSVRAGEDIALHRALRNLDAPAKMREHLPHFRVPDMADEVDRAVQLAEDRFRRSWQTMPVHHVGHTDIDEPTLELHRRLNGR